MKFLCWFGFHKWRKGRTYVGATAAIFRQESRYCERCDKLQKALVMFHEGRTHDSDWKDHGKANGWDKL